MQMPDKPNLIFNFWRELKRRKVVRVTAMYAATAFIIIEAAEIMLPRLGLPDRIVTLLIIVFLIGFPFAAVISWIYDITPEGILKTKPANLEKEESQAVRTGGNIINANNIVIAILFVAVCVLLYPKIFGQQKTDDVGLEISNSNILIAVLPFSNLKPDPETEHLGRAIAIQIIGNLTYLNNITVRSYGSVSIYDKQIISPVAAGDSLKVDYVLIGNILKEGNMVRLNVELVKVDTDEKIWGEIVEVNFNSDFEL